MNKVRSCSKHHYKEPVIDKVLFTEVLLICTSDIVESPDKPFGWEWDDDNY